MFDYNNWVLCEYSEDVIEQEDQFIHLIYKETDVNIIIPHYILNTPDKKILTYEYEPFMVDLFNSFSSYDDIVNQSYIDLIRSTSYINNRKIKALDTHKRLLNKMDLYTLSQKMKYSILMLLTQAVLGVPYHFICDLYPDYHVGELNFEEGVSHRATNRIYIDNNILKVKITKTLRVFSIDNNSNDITYKVLILKVLADVKKGTLTFMIRHKIDIKI